MTKMDMKIVKITWLDSLTQSPWTDLDEVEQLRPVTVVSVGYLVCEDNAAVTIVGMIGLENCMSMIQVIPKGCILTINEYTFVRRSYDCSVTKYEEK